jgi:hypothetical protein
MALLEDIVKGNGLTTLAIGAAVVVLVPIVLPVATALVKPVAKAVVKSGIIVYEKARETVAEVGEVGQDIIAEARAELAQETPAPAAPKGGKSAS